MDNKVMGAFIDRSGERFGRLLVISRDNSKPPASFGRRTFWVCLCDCGKMVSKSVHDLTDGSTRSCGCLFEDTRQKPTGWNRTPTYRSWMACKMRCLNKNVQNFHRYGGRGIMICKRWLHSFENFLEDMGEKPKGKTLDRIDNEKGYFPSNCRWATPREQYLNSSNARLILWKGERRTLKEISEIEGLKRTTLNSLYLKTKDIELSVNQLLNR